MNYVDRQDLFLKNYESENFWTFRSSVLGEYGWNNSWEPNMHIGVRLEYYYSNGDSGIELMNDDIIYGYPYFCLRPLEGKLMHCMAHLEEGVKYVSYHTYIYEKDYFTPVYFTKIGDRILYDTEHIASKIDIKKIRHHNFFPFSYKKYYDDNRCKIIL